MKYSIFVGFVVLAVAALSTPCQGSQTVTPASVYSVKFVCGFSSSPVGPFPSEPPVKPGNYATAINIHNFHIFSVGLCKKAVLAPPEACMSASPPEGCLPIIGNFTGVFLHADQAFEVDCSDIVSLLKPSLRGTTLPPFIKGFVEIVVLPNSNLAGTPPVNPLSVTGVYTAQGCVGNPLLGKPNLGNPIVGECLPRGGVAEEVVPQNSFNGELPAADACRG